MGIKGAGMDLGIPSRVLRQNGPHSYVGSFDINDELALWVRVNQDRGSGESLLEFLESFLGLLAPEETDSGGCQAGEECGDSTIIPDESSIKVSESQETL